MFQSQSLFNLFPRNWETLRNKQKLTDFNRKHLMKTLVATGQKTQMFPDHKGVISLKLLKR